MILVAHDQDANVTVVDTGDHVGRKGAGLGKFAGYQLKAGTVKKVVFDLNPEPHEREKTLHQTVRHGARAAAMSR